MVGGLLLGMGGLIFIGGVVVVVAAGFKKTGALDKVASGLAFVPGAAPAAAGLRSAGRPGSRRPRSDGQSRLGEPRENPNLRLGRGAVRETPAATRRRRAERARRTTVLMAKRLVRRVPGASGLAPLAQSIARGQSQRNVGFTMRRSASTAPGLYQGSQRTTITGGYAAATVPSSGIVTIYCGPMGLGMVWYPQAVAISTTTGANDASTCALYLSPLAERGHARTSRPRSAASPTPGAATRSVSRSPRSGRACSSSPSGRGRRWGIWPRCRSTGSSRRWWHDHATAAGSADRPPGAGDRPRRRRWRVPRAAHHHHRLIAAPPGSGIFVYDNTAT